MKSKSKRIVIVGGVAAGMSAASRARRNDPGAEIIVLEKSGYVSYGACGLPYFISGEIHQAGDLVAITVDEFRQKRNIDVRLHHEAVSFDPRKKVVTTSDLQSGKTEIVPYDRLIIATGARPVIPDITGIDLGNIFVLRSLESGIWLRSKIDAGNFRNGLIAGGGYIGLEMAEALTKRGICVTVVEMRDHLMGSVDSEISSIIENELIANGCRVIKSEKIVSFEGENSVRSARLMRNGLIESDLVILSAGVKPEIAFAKTGGVQLGRTGAIAVTPNMRTNVFNVFAAGDCAEVKNLVTGKNDYIPLGTTANKQGRVAGDNASGKFSKFTGVTGTTAVKIFDLEVARTGITQRQAESLKLPVKTVVIEGKSRAGYYPGFRSIVVKLVFNVNNGRLLGAQMAGKEGVAKRIDIFSTALYKKMTISEITELDLSYAPPFAPVWDPVLIAVQQAAKLVRKHQ